MIWVRREVSVREKNGKQEALCDDCTVAACRVDSVPLL